MAKWALDDREQLHKDANQALDEHLAPEETVRVILRGPNSSMIATDRRVFVFRKGMFGRGGLSTFDYEEISGVTLKTGMMQGHVALQGPGLQTTGIGHGSSETHPSKVPHAIEITNEQQAEAKERVPILRRTIDEFHANRQAAGSGTPDVMDQLRKLGELRDAGILTEQEFEAKKAELLSRL